MTADQQSGGSMKVLCAYPECPNRISHPKTGPFPVYCPEHRQG